MKKLLLALLLTTTLGVSAQTSPAGTWVADVPTPDGSPVRFIITLSIRDDTVLGSLRIGATDPVPIEGGRLRGDVVSFHRTLDDTSRIAFLARVVDDSLRVGMMPMPGGEPGATVEKTAVVNFTAKRWRGEFNAPPAPRDQR